MLSCRCREAGSRQERLLFVPQGEHGAGVALQPPTRHVTANKRSHSAVAGATVALVARAIAHRPPRWGSGRALVHPRRLGAHRPGVAGGARRRLLCQRTGLLHGPAARLRRASRRVEIAASGSARFALAGRGRVDFPPRAPQTLLPPRAAARTP